MDRDSLVTKSKTDVNSLENNDDILSEAQRQVMLALVLMLAGLSLAVAGLAGFVWRLLYLAGLGFSLRNRRNPGAVETRVKVPHRL